MNIVLMEALLFMNATISIMLILQDPQIDWICLLLVTSTLTELWKILMENIAVLLFMKWINKQF